MLTLFIHCQGDLHILRYAKCAMGWNYGKYIFQTNKPLVVFSHVQYGKNYCLKIPGLTRIIILWPKWNTQNIQESLFEDTKLRYIWVPNLAHPVWKWSVMLIHIHCPWKVYKIEFFTKGIGFNRKACLYTNVTFKWKLLCFDQISTTTIFQGLYNCCPFDG